MPGSVRTRVRPRAAPVSDLAQSQGPTQHSPSTVPGSDPAQPQGLTQHSPRVQPSTAPGSDPAQPQGPTQHRPRVPPSTVPGSDPAQPQGLTQHSPRVHAQESSQCGQHHPTDKKKVWVAAHISSLCMVGSSGPLFPMDKPLPTHAQRNLFKPLAVNVC